jgi:hypothetical protein
MIAMIGILVLSGVLRIAYPYSADRDYSIALLPLNEWGFGSEPVFVQMFSCGGGEYVGYEYTLGFFRVSNTVPPSGPIRFATGSRPVFPPPPPAGTGSHQGKQAKNTP